MTAANTPLDQITDPFLLSARLHELGCAVAVFTPEELGSIDGGDVEDAMVEAGHERIEFLAPFADQDDEDEDDGLSPAERHERSGKTGPCDDLAPDTAGENPNVCTTCLHHAIDHPTGTGILSPAVTAEAHSDDHAVEISFDATAWFATAGDQEIAGLIGIGFGGDYAADAVAEHYSDGPTRLLFDYLASRREQRDAPGFECHVDREQAQAWIAAHRPRLLGE